MTDTPKPLTSAELADLKAKAKAASPGKWIILNETDVWTTDDKFIACTDLGDVTEFEKNNADHIAAANPETILRLIAMIEWRDKQIEKLRGAMVHFRKMGFEKAREALAATEPFNDKR